MSTAPPWVSHRILVRQAILQADVENTSPLRIGSGRDPPLGSQADLAVVRIYRNGRDEPYIPGSSLKGVFRSVGEAMARAEKNLQVCSGLAKSTCMDLKQIDGVRLGDQVGSKLRRNDVEGAINLFNRYACLMCKIFGAPSYGAHVYFVDAYVTGEYTINTRTGIAIDRRTGAAFRGALYTVEYVEPGSTFRLGIHTTNLPNYVLGMFAKIMKMVDRGEVRVGGFKTRGFGELKLKSVNVRIKDLRKPGSMVLEKMDEKDNEADLGGLVEFRDGFLHAEGDGAHQVLDRLEEVWDRANLTD